MELVATAISPHDSGCAKTTIRTDVFKRIPNAEKIQINQMPNVFVQSCSGEKSKILGHAALRFTFQGENGKTVSFIHDVLITDFVQHALLVGCFLVYIVYSWKF